MHVPIYSILSLLLFSAVAASHSSFEHSHARKSLLIKKQVDAGGASGPPVPAPSIPTGDGGATVPTATGGGAVVTDTSTPTDTGTPTTPLTPTAPTSVATSPSDTPTTAATSPTGTPTTAATTPTDSPTSAATTATPDPTTTATTTKGILDPVTSLLSSVIGDVTSVLAPTSVTPTDTPASTAPTDTATATAPTDTPTATAPTDTPTTALTPTDTATTPTVPPTDTPTTTAPTDSATAPPTDTPTTTATGTATTPNDPLSSIINTLTSILLPPSQTPSGTDTPTTPIDTQTTATAPPTDSPTVSTPPPTDSPTVTAPPTDTNSPTVTAPPTDSPTVSASPTDSPTDTSTGTITPGNPLSSIISSLTSILLPPTQSDTPTDSPSAPPSGTPTITDSPTVTDSPTAPPVSSSPTITDSPSVPPSGSPTITDSGSAPPSGSPTITDSPPSSSPTITDFPPSSSPTITDSPSAPPSGSPTITDSPSVPPTDSASQSSVVITFPGSDSSVTSATALPDSVSTSATTDNALPSATASVDPGLVFILTESSLALASVPTTTADPTLTDPDQVPTSVGTLLPLSATSAALAAAALPSNIPSRIYPNPQLDPSENLDGYTLISVLFTPALSWVFVVNSLVSSSQIFGYMPILIANGLGIPTDNIKTFALQVQVPTTYKSPADSAVLGTLFLAYIPSDQVDTLAALIRTKNSRFYTATPDPIASDLAQQVNTGYSLVSVPDPIKNPSDTGTNSPAGTGAVSNSKSRQDAIIGVTSALGAIAVLVLVFLVYRSLKRRRELAHRRLSDPADMSGYRPDGREFDQDSLGNQRRRSFYYAEDSLRGFGGQQQRQEDVRYDHRTANAQTGQMRNRNLGPTAISAPILRESSMNW